MKIGYCSDSPFIPTSYGTQGSMIAGGLAGAGHEVIYMAVDSMGGKSEAGAYTVEACTLDRPRAGLPHVSQLINKHDIDMFITHADMQHNRKLDMHRNHVWIANMPLDTEDITAEIMELVTKADVKIFESAISVSLMRAAGLRNAGWIPCAVHEAFHPAVPRQHVKDMLDIDDDKFYILFVGRPNWRKNVPSIFVTIRKLLDRGHDGIVLLCHMDLNDPAATISYSQLIHALGIEKHVVVTTNSWVTGVDRKTLNDIYNCADVYFQPHGGEGFGITIAEAMATGLPVVATNYTSSREMIGDDERGTRIPYRGTMEMMGVQRPFPSPGDCADALEPYITGEIDAKKVGRKASAFSLDNYSRERVVNSWLELVDRNGIRRKSVHEV